jgi:tRNA (guanine37-N1)-methyltransferase
LIVKILAPIDNKNISGGLPAYPQYTQPRIFEGMAVPEVLLSGHHGEIERWRRQRRLERTRQLRLDLLGE